MAWPVNPEPFFVQESDREMWHVETPDDPEEMLCGKKISVDLPSARVQKRFGVKPCPWCRHSLEEALSSLQGRSSGTPSSPPNPTSPMT